MHAENAWRFRGAEADDVDALAALHVASWRWAYRGLLDADVLDRLSVDERASMWRELIDGGETVVVLAERGDRLLGFASGAASRDDDARPGTGEVGAIYLAEEAAGTGLGTELFVEIQGELRARGFVRATLWVLESNARARRFYEREGWRWDGSTSDHQIQCDRQPIVRYAGDL